MANSNKAINVAVGVIKKQDKYFVCRRLAHQHQGNKWEFPGGKVDAGETIEQALYRELKEEIGISACNATTLTQIDFNYPDKNVSLHVFLVSEFSGSPTGLEGQESIWVDYESLCKLEFPDANRIILEKLALMHR